MRSLYLRIWLTVVAALALFAVVSGYLWHRHVDQERAQFEAAASERLQAWAELVQRSLPPADAPPAEQAQALRDWSQRLRVPLALDNALGQRIGASDSFLRREADGAPPAASVRLDDGRTLWLARRLGRRLPPADGTASGIDWLRRPDASQPRLGPAGDHPAGEPVPRFGAGGPRLDGDGPRRIFGPDGPMGGEPGGMMGPPLPPMLFGLPRAVGPLLVVALLFVAVAAGAFPVVRRLTRRLEALKQGVEAFGAGDLTQRVDAQGRDEVAAVATTFNRSAERIEALVRSHQSLLANASHELRSPLARLKMAVAMYPDAGEHQRYELQHEINTNIAELDALVEEVLLASRLDGAQAIDRDDDVDLLGLATEEAARVGAQPQGEPLTVRGSERLLRRALRNLLENARRYGGDDVQVHVEPAGPGQVRVRVCDRGPGVPEPLRERIFEPFYRLPGHAEREGGVGLGLSLVRQIAQRHGGSVHCESREGGGTCFVLALPRQTA
jgi:signal transduction histidine kinase